MLRYNPTGVGLSAPAPGSLRLLQLQGLWITGAPTGDTAGLTALQLQGVWISGVSRVEPVRGTQPGSSSVGGSGMQLTDKVFLKYQKAELLLDEEDLLDILEMVLHSGLLEN